MPITIDGDGTITGVSVGGLPDGIVDTDMLAAGAVTAAKRGAGAILQVQSTVKTTAFSSSSTSFTDITGLSVSITPSSTSNKILVFSSFTASGNTWSSGSGTLFSLVRGSTGICQGTGGSSLNATAGFNAWSNGEGNTRGNYSSMSIQFLDSPSTTSATTYKIQGRQTYTVGTPTFTVGSRNQDATLGFASVITAMDVAA